MLAFSECLVKGKTKETRSRQNGKMQTLECREICCATARGRKDVPGDSFRVWASNRHGIIWSITTHMSRHRVVVRATTDAVQLVAHNSWIESWKTPSKLTLIARRKDVPPLCHSAFP